MTNMDNLKPCKYCGSKIFYMKQRYYGTLNFHIGIDRESNREVEDNYMNEGIYDNCHHEYLSEYLWCSKCDKRGILAKLLEGKL